jgi:hypothetical protein
VPTLLRLRGCALQKCALRAWPRACRAALCDHHNKRRVRSRMRPAANVFLRLMAL